MEKFNYTFSQFARMVREILKKTLDNELRELADKYDIPQDNLMNIAVNMYVQDMSKVQWKAGKTKFVKIYETEVKLLLDKGLLDWKELGFLTYLSVNFTTYEDNALRNKDGSYCSQKDIIEHSKISKPTISKLLNDLTKKGIIFYKKHPTIKNGKRYLLSPYVFYRGKMIDRELKEKLSILNKSVKEAYKQTKQENRDKIEEAVEFDFDLFDAEGFTEKLEEAIIEEKCNQQLVEV